MKILYVCNDLAYFKAHRWFLAQAMIDKGWQVSLSTGVERSAEKIEKNGAIKILEVALDRHQLNFKSDFGLIRAYLRQLKNEKPNVVHAITIKPILFMGVALFINKLLLRKTPKLILTYPGLGKVFEPDKSMKAKVRKFIVSSLLGFSNRFLKPQSTFENYSSMEELEKEKVVTSDRASVVMGAGINRDLFYSENRKGDLTVLFASRLLNAKGLGEFIKAARKLGDEFPKATFQIAGRREADNPDAFPIEEIIRAHDEGVIQYLGVIDPENMPDILRQSDIHIAPSKLQEGLPRVVLEAASCGCCIIASDHEMLQRFIVDGKTGWLLSEITSELIEEKLRLALSSPKETRNMGKITAEKMSDLPIFEDNLISYFENLYQI